MNNSTEQHAKDYAYLVNQLMDTITLTEISNELSEQLPRPYPFQQQFRVFEGQSHDYVGQRIFGGQVLAQALMAAYHTIPHDNQESQQKEMVDSSNIDVQEQTLSLSSIADTKPCHSLHGYFLRGGDIDMPVLYQVQTLRDGRSLSARRVTAIQFQNDKEGNPVEQVIFSMIASFAPMESGLEYQPEMPIYPPVEDLLSEQELKDQIVGKIPNALKARFMRQRHVEIKPVKPRDPIHPEPMTPKQANWLRIPKLGTQSIAVQQALLAFSSDFYLVGTGLMSHGVSFMTKGLQAASIDHSMHFHRPFDMNEWMLYDMWSDNTAHAKGLNHGQFWQGGNLIATVQQEGLMRLRAK